MVQKGFSGDTRALGERFFLYGVMAEIFGRKTGFAEGLGNSMHAFFIPFGIYPNNAIVGGSAPIATGAALFKKVQKKPGVCVANAGDGSTGCGPVWEAMNFAFMDQLHTLWDEKGGLPVLFNFVNNGYGMGGQTCLCRRFLAESFFSDYESAVDSLPEGFSRLEADDLRCRDFHRFSGVRISAGTCCAFLHLKGAEAQDLNVSAAFKFVCDDVQRRADCFLRHFLRHSRVVGYRFDEFVLRHNVFPPVFIFGLPRMIIMPLSPLRR